MPKKILFIENDSAFAAGIAESLEATGFDVRITADGKDGVELAREWAPDAVVLCVELPGMSGYLVCQKLKKDDALRSLPLVLTSAEATAETFEKHRTLKARADDYLLKPYTPQELIDRLAALVGLPEAADPLFIETGEEELVTLEEDLPFEDAVEDAPALSLDALDDEPVGDAPAAPPQEDEDLRLLDDAFDGLATATPDEEAAALEELTGERPMTGEADAAGEPAAGDDREEPGALAAVALDDEADAALGALDASDAGLEVEAPVDELGALGSMDDLDLGPPDDEGALAAADAELGALAAPDDELDALAAGEELGTLSLTSGAGELAREPLDLDDPLGAPAPAAAAPVRGASADLLRAAGIMILDEGPSAPAGEAGGGDPARLSRLERELADARDGLDVTRGKLADRDRQLSERDAAVADAAARIRELERRLGEADGEAERARTRAEAAEARAEAAAGQARRAEAEALAGREDLRRAAEQAEAAGAELAALRTRLADAERRAQAAEEEARRQAAEVAAATERAARAEAAEREAAELRTELVVARGEADGARGEVERRTAELRKRLTDLEAANAKHEERVVKAYQKIKSDEKVREKVRKALAIASQLLDDGALPSDAPDKERRPAAVAGRE